MNVMTQPPNRTSKRLFTNILMPMVNAHSDGDTEKRNSKARDFYFEIL